jgi:hypothetical protein
MIFYSKPQTSLKTGYFISALEAPVQLEKILTGYLIPDSVFSFFKISFSKPERTQEVKRRFSGE